MMRSFGASMGPLVSILFGLLLSLIAHSACAEPVTTIRNNGDPANRVDIAILGDGYTAAQLGLYAADVEAFVDGLFNQEPFQEYRRYFNVHRVDVMSTESGADHPERQPPLFRATALEATYNCFAIQRLICVDTSKVFDVLQRSMPPVERDVVIVIVNDPEYGGSGGSVAVASTNTQVVELVLHELGHSFGLLADEYDTDPQLCNNSVEPFEPNVTRQVVRSGIKWNVGGSPPTGWVDLSTPIPTNNPVPGIVGLFEGARYCTRGMFRPTFNSKMRSLDRPFEQVNSEQLIRRVYNWVSPIDSSEPFASTVTLRADNQQLFRVESPRPLTGALAIMWKLDGQSVDAGSELTLTSSDIASGRHVLEVRVEDPTPFVRNDPANVLVETRTWTLNSDGSRPDTTITSGPTGLVTSNTAAFSWSGTDDLTPQASLQYAFRLDPMEPAFSSFGALTTTTYSDLANGNYIFLVKSRDAAGNEDLTPASQTFNIEVAGLGPQTIINSGPPPLTKSANSIFVFASTAPDSKFTCSLDAAAFTNCRSPKKYSRLLNGFHTFQVTATDLQGIADSTPATHTWTIDTARPDTMITATPAALTKIMDASFEFSSNEGSSTFQCKLNKNAFAPCTSPQIYAGLTSGKHVFQVAATDSFGNVDKKAALYKWTIDTTAPETTIKAKPRSLTKSTSAKFSFLANEPGSLFECSLDNAPFAPCLSPRVFPALAPGPHIIEVRATDRAGNTDPTPASFGWTIQ